MHPLCVQWPELCTLGAISFTSNCLLFVKKNSIPMVPIYSKFRIILLAIIIASLAIDKLIFAGTFDSINIPF